MIILKAYKVLYDNQKNPVLCNGRIVVKWKLSTIEEFDFDITNPKEWLAFLRTYKTQNDKLLPDKSPAGDKIVYSVYSFGMLPSNYEGVFPKRIGTSFFPGYDKDAQKRDLCLYGQLR